MRCILRILAVVTVASCAIVPARGQEHGALYGGFGAGGPSALAAGVDALRAEALARTFYRAFQGRIEPATISQARAEMFGAAILDRPNNPSLDNPRLPAGFTFFGQFLDHDITGNPDLRFVQVAERLQLLSDAASAEAFVASVASGVQALAFEGDGKNERTGFLDLDSVYGDTTSAVLDVLANPPTDSGTLEMDDGNVMARRIAELFERDANGAFTGRFRIEMGGDGLPDLPRCTGDPADSPVNCGLKPGDDPEKRLPVAIIGDGRNDENVLISQIHLLFLRAHNKLYEQHRGVAPGAPVTFDPVSFSFARRTLTEHYQAMIRDEYLPLSIGREMVAGILEDGYAIYTEQDATLPTEKPYCPAAEARIPHEFAVAAFRFGHSQVRPGYRVNPQSARPIFRRDPSNGALPPNDLSGRRSIDARTRLDWTLFFALPDATPSPSTRIDTIVANPLGELPKKFFADAEGFAKELPKRNTVRVSDIAEGGIPIASGFAIADWLVRSGGAISPAVRPLTAEQLGTTHMARRADDPFGGAAPTVEELPLWAYILAEAEVQNGGRFLGDVGGRLVGEVFLGLLSCDPEGIERNPYWRVTLPSARDGVFTMADLIAFVED